MPNNFCDVVLCRRMFHISSYLGFSVDSSIQQHGKCSWKMFKHKILLLIFLDGTIASSKRGSSRSPSPLKQPDQKRNRMRSSEWCHQHSKYYKIWKIVVVHLLRAGWSSGTEFFFPLPPLEDRQFWRRLKIKKSKKKRIFLCFLVDGRVQSFQKSLFSLKSTRSRQKMAIFRPYSLWIFHWMHWGQLIFFVLLKDRPG